MITVCLSKGFIAHQSSRFSKQTINHLQTSQRKWTIAVSCTTQQGQVYMKPIKTHMARVMTSLLLCVWFPWRQSDTASTVYLRCCCHASRKWITNADGTSSPTETHEETFRVHEKNSSATQVLDVSIRSGVFCFVNVGLELMKHFVFY